MADRPGWRPLPPTPDFLLRALRRLAGRVPESPSLVARLARLGYSAKGAVYLLVGALAMAAALGSAERPRGARAALSMVRGQPLGMVVLAAVAAGLAGHVVWRVAQAVLDPDRLGSGPRGLATRAGYLLSAALYGSLVAESLRLLRVLGGGGDPGWEAAHWTALLLQHPGGRVLAGVAGAATLTFGLYELYRARAADPVRRLDLSGVSPPGRRWIVRLSRAGRAARGVVFGIVGWLLVRAAVTSVPLAAVGMAGALRVLQARSDGPWVLGCVGLGLAAYGAYQLACARYRRIARI